MMRVLLALLLLTSLRAATSVSQHGITWTFDGSYTTGQYANGDSYVVAPSGLTITGISPASTATTGANSTVTISNASPAVVTWTGHSLSYGALIRFSTTGTLNTGVMAGTLYYVRNTGKTTDTFQISASPPTSEGADGSAVNTSSAGSGTHTCTTERHKNGSMINPVPLFATVTQGFDSAMYAQYAHFYSHVLNKARPNDAEVSGGNPLTVAAGSSLISSASLTDVSVFPDRVQLQDTAILTVVSSAPSANSFRPPMFGTNKTHSWNKSDINYSVLGSLATVTGAPSLATLEALFEYPWQTGFFSTGSLLQNTSTMRNPYGGVGGLYGREQARAVAAAVLSLHLNYTNEQKETLLIRVIQLGLDFYGIVAFGGELKDNAGIELGIKLPVVLAGLVLNSSAVLASVDAGGLAGTNKLFPEDLQTWYVIQSDVGRSLTSTEENPRDAYLQGDVGLAEAGVQHTRDPSFDGRNWETLGYRDIVGVSHMSNALAARLITGGAAAWNWPAFFDYADRYEANQITAENYYFPSTFEQNMWDAYRGAYPPLFSAHPASVVKAVASNHTFTVSVSGSPTPTLQWRKATLDMSGETSSSLVLTNIQLADAGSYDCVATNSEGTATSNAAILTVTGTPSLRPRLNRNAELLIRGR